LCVRVCRDLVGAAAIGFIGRGANREVGAPFHVQAEACIGCGQPYALKPMLFLRDLVTVGAELWGICLACRRKKAPARLDFIQRGGQAYPPIGN
jgi:hypothetical protein